MLGSSAALQRGTRQPNQQPVQAAHATAGTHNTGAPAPWLQHTCKHVQLGTRRVWKVQCEAACSALPAGRRASGGVQRERQRGIRRALVPRSHRSGCKAGWVRGTARVRPRGLQTMYAANHGRPYGAGEPGYLGLAAAGHPPQQHQTHQRQTKSSALPLPHLQALSPPIHYHTALQRAAPLPAPLPLLPPLLAPLQLSALLPPQRAAWGLQLRLIPVRHLPPAVPRVPLPAVGPVAARVALQPPPPGSTAGAACLADRRACAPLAPAAGPAQSCIVRGWDWGLEGRDGGWGHAKESLAGATRTREQSTNLAACTGQLRHAKL